MYSVSCVLYLLQYMSPFFIVHGWIPSGQTSYMYVCICNLIFMYLMDLNNCYKSKVTVCVSWGGNYEGQFFSFICTIGGMADKRETKKEVGNPQRLCLWRNPVKKREKRKSTWKEHDDLQVSHLPVTPFLCLLQQAIQIKTTPFDKYVLKTFMLM